MINSAITLSIRPKWPDIPDDYAVRSQGYEIGRIRHAADAGRPDQSWEWFILIPMGLPIWASGAAQDRDTAIKAFSAAWGRLLKETKPSDCSGPGSFRERRNPGLRPRASQCP